MVCRTRNLVLMFFVIDVLYGLSEHAGAGTKSNQEAPSLSHDEGKDQNDENVDQSTGTGNGTVNRKDA